MSEIFTLKSNYMIGLIGWYCDQNLDSPLNGKFPNWAKLKSDLFQKIFFQLKMPIFHKLQLPIY